MSSEWEVLQWIAEDSEGMLGAPFRMLLLRLAMNLRTKEKGTITGSVELALSDFEKGTLLRTLRGLEKKDFVHAVQCGNKILLSNLDLSIDIAVDIVLTEAGEFEVTRSRSSISFSDL